MDNKFLHKEYGISEELLTLATKSEILVRDEFDKINKMSYFNQYKVIKAFQNNRVSDIHFMPSSGYGYSDVGRERLDAVYAEVFKGQDALVRQSIASGTAAINLAIAANVRPSDEILFITGEPYDTLKEAVGISGNAVGSLKEYGVTYKIQPLLPNGTIDFDAIASGINEHTKMIFMQRSRGYEWRSSVMCDEIERASSIINKINSDLIIFVDNCYGEFVEEREPLECGATLIAGSLIKNVGGGIAPTGGYIVGNADLIENCASRMYSPGLSKEVGSSTADKRLLFQGLYVAPHTVSQSLKGAVFTAAILAELGYETSPLYTEKRGDIIQLIKFEKESELITFCQNIQKSSPVDAHVLPCPWDMPGYQEKVIMAAGTFVQGASIEFSADAPIKEPYIAYLQGGLVYAQVKLGVLLALQSIKNNEIM